MDEFQLGEEGLPVEFPSLLVNFTAATRAVKAAVGLVTFPVALGILLGEVCGDGRALADAQVGFSERFRILGIWVEAGTVL